MKVVAGRYQIIDKREIGFAAEVYRVEDTRTGRRLALKLYRNDTPFPEYSEHLFDIQKSLAPFNVRHLLLPLDTGVEEGRFWQVFEYIEGYGTLGDLISANGPLWPGNALDVLAKIAAALVQLHKLNIIHADIKPDNILIEHPTGEPRLTDFGLVQRVGEVDDLIIIGTYQYLHPDLRSSVPLRQESERGRLQFRGSIGPYLDIYSLGVVTFEMLTGERIEPHPLSTDRVVAILLAKNPALRTSGTAVVETLAKLLCRMLGVSSSVAGIDAVEIAATAATLKDAFPNQRTGALQEGTVPSPAGPAVSAPNSEVAVLNAAVDSLRAVAERLVVSTAAMLRTAERLEEFVPASKDSELLSDMKNAFDQAFGRIRASWRVGIGMTLCTFVLTVTMIVCAIVFGIRTGTSGWTLVFGGASAVSVLGTLLWRPYDRAFRATILAQQIEMIHVQTIATFRGTTDLNKRLEICREAISSLGAILETHAVAGDNRDKRQVGRVQSRKKEKGTDLFSKGA
jgi:serine/threonine protein kinase